MKKVKFPRKMIIVHSSSRLPWRLFKGNEGKHKYSIKQVSLETKISETIISNLENNNFNSLPKIVFKRLS